MKNNFDRVMILIYALIIFLSSLYIGISKGLEANTPVTNISCIFILLYAFFMIYLKTKKKNVIK